VFGYGDTNQRRVVPLFVRGAIGDAPINLKYRKSGRQFIHVTDAVAGYILAATTLSDCGRGNSKESRPEDRSPFTPSFHFSIEDYPDTDEPFIRMEPLAKTVASLFPSEIDDSNCVDYPKDENKIQALNCARTREELNWSIRKSLKDGMAELGDWYNASGDNDTLRSMMAKDLDSIVQTLKTTKAK
jgi:nucleoside-diphosphate-sugar epimerase